MNTLVFVVVAAFGYLCLLPECTSQRVAWDEEPTYEDLIKARDFVQDAIKRDRIVLFSKTYCPYSKKVKAILNSYGARYQVYEVNNMFDGRAIMEYMEKLTGAGTVPRFFVNGRFVGGSETVQQMDKKGELKPLLDGDLSAIKMTG